ncbi:hypothetical protein SAMN02745193_00325 [Erythrobacter sanguineus]|uniref:Uncharacterized protein n=2 Tax=Erythrobacter sanguineus TaxID=198312 RepID=A0A1M7RSS8_9SPHN|nr:hypothetical protein SAMN02745193_00325 [Erythrobacter sanguineus]
MLFAPGMRPTCDAIRSFVSRQHAVSLSHDPTEDAALSLVVADGEHLRATEADAAPLWVELLRDGLTFDLHGLAPGAACGTPDIAHRFDLATTPDGDCFESLVIAPGPHLAGGGRSVPVLRAMLALARDLSLHFPDLAAVYWGPSRSAIGRRFFESVITAWLDGGAFPALGLTAFEESDDGALQSVGLAFWIGQELRIEPPLSIDKVAATRLGVRLINQLVIVGGIGESERIIAPDGTRLVMQASRNSRFVRVRRE